MFQAIRTLYADLLAKILGTVFGTNPQRKSKTKSYSSDVILGEIDILKTQFTNCRAYFPHMTNASIGCRNINTAPFYLNKGFNITFAFNQPLVEEDVRKNNEIADWINQNVLVRLCAMLESYGILSKGIRINKSIDGWKELDLLRRLRDVFAHTSGKYNPHNKDQRKLVQKLICHFKLSNKDPQSFPLDIDKVIYPLFEGCKKYVEVKHATNI